MCAEPRDKYADLDKIARWYDTTVDFDRYLIVFKHRSIKANLCGDRVLELGCASGVMTRLFLDHLKHLDVLEGAKDYIDILKPELGDRVDFFHSLWEDFKTDRTYSDMVMAGALEHLDDPIGVVKKISAWLDSKSESAIHLTVPNANSLHRKIGVAMGMIPSVTSLSERDRMIGHKRVYTFELLREHIEAAGLKIVHHEGIYLKPLTHADMEKWPIERINAFYEVGKEVPDLCAEIYVKCAVRR